MDQPGEVVVNPTRGLLNRKNVVSLSQFAVPSLTRFLLAVQYTMSAKNMQTVGFDGASRPLGASSVSIEKIDDKASCTFCSGHGLQLLGQVRSGHIAHLDEQNPSTGRCTGISISNLLPLCTITSPTNN